MSRPLDPSSRSLDFSETPYVWISMTPLDLRPLDSRHAAFEISCGEKFYRGMCGWGLENHIQLGNVSFLSPFWAKAKPTDQQTPQKSSTSRGHCLSSWPTRMLTSVAADEFNGMRGSWPGTDAALRGTADPLPPLGKEPLDPVSLHKNLVRDYIYTLGLQSYLLRRYLDPLNPSQRPS